MSNTSHEIMSLRDFFNDNKIEPEVIDLLSISPLDMKTISNSVKKTGKLLIVDTCHKSFSTGKEIIANITENNLNHFKTKPILMGMPNTPVPTSFSLTKNYYPSKRDIAINIGKILNKKINLNKIQDAKEHDKPREFIGSF